MIQLLNNIWSVYQDMAFWLILGLLAAGLVKVYIPEDAMKRWLGGRGFAAVARAALFGAPLPLCSCGVLPAALALRRAGASKEATVSFLISTPETSIDSVAVTYALMGPVMAIYRPLAALMSAVITGMLTLLVDDVPVPVQKTADSCCGSANTSCCTPDTRQGSCASEPMAGRAEPSRLKQAIKFAAADLLDDISRWLLIGILVAGLMITLIPPGFLEQWQGFPAILVMLLVGIPLYICAVASTPIAAGLLLAGVSPGAVLVFLLVGPATNIASLILLRNELGMKVTLVYLGGIAGVSVFMALLLDMLVKRLSLEILAKVGPSHQLLPEFVSLLSAILLLILAIPFIRKKLLSF
ncbi:MAG: SO_0444 family Cu/Zn efflux transporter [Gammaproteobacteria bacterium]|nr:SO_0444 family Cu/Zn efflux transporter [Gammaproteobacteria bacterium]